MTQELLAPSESYAFGIIRVLCDEAFNGCLHKQKDDLKPTSWLALAHPTRSSVGMEFKLLTGYLMKRDPYMPENNAVFVSMSDVMDISGLGIFLRDNSQKVGPECYLGESVARARGVDEAIRQLKLMVGPDENDQITLPQYAIANKKEDITVRKAALSGRLKTARKIGGRWVVDKNEPWPEDGRRTK